MVKMRWSARYTDWLAKSFLLTMVLVIFVFEIAIIRPYLVAEKYRWVPMHVCAACIIVFNICCNLYLVITTDTSTLKIVVPSSLAPDWRFCLLCEANSPPRSFHCNTCDRCILRRDHHCVFTGCCVGYKNYRYYMGLLFQISLACVYASLFHYGYVWSNMNGLNPFTFFAHCMPIPFFMFGAIDLWTLFCNVISMLCIVGALFASGLMVYHMNLLARNQTTYERAHGITKYSRKHWHLNLTETLGPSWPWTIFVSPLLGSSKLPRDGLYFPTVDQHKETQ